MPVSRLLPYRYRWISTDLPIITICTHRWCWWSHLSPPLWLIHVGIWNIRSATQSLAAASFDGSAEASYSYLTAGLMPESFPLSLLRPAIVAAVAVQAINVCFCGVFDVCFQADSSIIAPGERPHSSSSVATERTITVRRGVRPRN